MKPTFRVTVDVGDCILARIITQACLAIALGNIRVSSPLVIRKIAMLDTHLEEIVQASAINEHIG